MRDSLLRRHCLICSSYQLTLHWLTAGEEDQALECFQQEVGPEVAGASSSLLRQVMAWIGQLRQAGLPEALVERCLAPGAADLITQQREQSKQLLLALKTEELASVRFLDIAQPLAALIGDGSGERIDELNTVLLLQWIDAVVSRRELYPIWVQRHQALEQPLRMEHGNLPSVFWSNN